MKNLSTYYVVFERPPGSKCWTLAGMALTARRADEIASYRANVMKRCAMVKRCVLPGTEEPDSYVWVHFSTGNRVPAPVEEIWR